MRNDDAYANAPHIADAERFPQLWAEAAARFRASARWSTLAYASAERARLDLFLPDGPAAGLLIFLHGGSWRAYGRESWSHLAAGPVARGWAVAIPSYTLAPEERIGGITRQVARAVDVAAAEVAGPVRLVGHSAGGHLVARMLCADVTLAAADRLAGCVPVSPLADLRPLLETSMNADLRLDPEEAEAESPAFAQLRPDAPPVTVWVGGDERPAFRDQARWLAEAWGARLVVEPRRHHFDVIAGLTEPRSLLTRAVLGED